MHNAPTCWCETSQVQLVSIHFVYYDVFVLGTIYSKMAAAVQGAGFRLFVEPMFGLQFYNIVLKNRLYLCIA